MVIQTNKYLDLEGLSLYDEQIKAWSNTAAQIGFKTVLKTTDGNKIRFYTKPNATLTDTDYVEIELNSADMQDQLDKLAAKVGATWDSTTKQYTLPLSNAFGSDITTAVAAINDLKTLLDTVNGADNVDGSFRKEVKDAVEALDSTAGIASVSNNVVTIKNGLTEADGIVTNNSGADIVLEEVAYTGAAADVSVADANNYFKATTAEGVFKELAEDLADAINAGKVIVEEGGESGNILKSYSFYQGVLTTDTPEQKAAKKLTTVNIPKDFLVKSATVKTVEKKDEPYKGAQVGDKYIDFVINTKEGSGITDQHIYVAINDLIHPISGATGTEVTVTVSETNEISATINTINAAKINYVSGSETVEAALTRIDGAVSVTGSIAEKIDTKVKTLDTLSDVAIATKDAGTGSGASKTSDVTTFAGGVSETDGIIGAGSADNVQFQSISGAEITGLFTNSANS